MLSTGTALAVVTGALILGFEMFRYIKGKYYQEFSMRSGAERYVCPQCFEDGAGYYKCDRCGLMCHTDCILGQPRIRYTCNGCESSD